MLSWLGQQDAVLAEDHRTTKTKSTRVIPSTTAIDVDNYMFQLAASSSSSQLRSFRPVTKRDSKSCSPPRLLPCVPTSTTSWSSKSQRSVANLLAPTHAWLEDAATKQAAWLHQAESYITKDCHLADRLNIAAAPGESSLVRNRHRSGQQGCGAHPECLASSLRQRRQ